MHFAATAVDEARRRIVEYLEANGTMLAKDARDVTGTSRKYIVPLLEYFDAQGITKRDGDVRRLRKA
jgi:selenocysteine-specific elongation factor